MNYFNPPTDNFYKFCAIAGLLLFATSIYYWESYIFSVKLKQAEYQVINDRAEKLYEEKKESRLMLILATNTNKALNDCMIKTFSKKYGGYSYCSKIHKHVSIKDEKFIDKKYKQWEKENKDTSKQLDKLTPQLKEKSIIIDTHIELLKELKFKGFLLFLISTILMWYGFINWYKKVQVHLDNILEDEANQFIKNESKFKRTLQRKD